MRTKVPFAAGLFVVFVFILGIVSFASHRAGVVASSAMSATTIFLGYTNDPIEGRLALFTFSNASPISVQRDYFYAFDFQNATGWVAQGTCSFPDKRLWSLSWPRFGRVLRPRESEIVAVPAPFTNRWRVSFPFAQPENKVLCFAVEAFPGLQKHGFLTNYDNPYRTKYWSDSSPIDP